MKDKERQNAPGEYQRVYNEFVVGNKLIPKNYAVLIDALPRVPYLQDKMGMEGYKMACEGDFSLFETVDPILRNWMASNYERDEKQLPKEIKQTLESGTLDDAGKKYLADHAKNPVFRLYCSLKSRENPVFRQYDDMMVDMIMEDTLRPLTESQIKQVNAMADSPAHAQEMIERNVEKQVQMAKMMFVAHLGQTNLVTNENEKVDMDRSVSSMVSHCSRTAFVFSKGDEKEVDRMMNSLTGAKMGKGAGIYGRFAATHSTKQGAAISDFKEKKGVSFRHQYGMDVAIGGLGNAGIAGRGGVPQTINMDGTCGHMYMRVDKGGAEKTSSLLVGFESDSPGKNNQQGHGHTSAATGEYMSSFLAQREDEMGAKYGGRIVDCTIFEPKDLSDALDEFTTQYRGMMYEAMKDPTARMRLEQANAMLSGKLMEPAQLETCLNKAGLSMEKAQNIAHMSAEKKHKDYQKDASKRGLEASTPMKEVVKPSKRVRFRARLGSSHAKEIVDAYKQAKTTQKTAVSKVAMSFNDFSKEAAKDTPAKKKWGLFSKSPQKAPVTKEKGKGL